MCHACCAHLFCRHPGFVPTCRRPIPTRPVDCHCSSHHPTHPFIPRLPPTVGLGPQAHPTTTLPLLPAATLPQLILDAPILVVVDCCHGRAGEMTACLLRVEPPPHCCTFTDCHACSSQILLLLGREPASQQFALFKPAVGMPPAPASCLIELLVPHCQDGRYAVACCPNLPGDSLVVNLLLLVAFDCIYCLAIWCYSDIAWRWVRIRIPQYLTSADCSFRCCRAAFWFCLVGCSLLRPYCRFCHCAAVTSTPLPPRALTCRVSFLRGLTYTVPVDCLYTLLPVLIMRVWFFCRCLPPPPPPAH